MCAKIIFVVCSCVVGYVSSAATYDQRQTGAFNVQVDLKDLRIFALMKGGKEEYVDYDYAYDYSEMTIKPQNGTTPKPLNGTTVADTINDNGTAVGITEQTILDIKTNSSQSLEAAEETSKNPINETSTTTKTLETVTTAATEMPDTWSTKEATTAVPRPTTTTTSGCKKGFFMNQKGDCELKMQGAGNALLKLVKLSQKLKLRRENRHNEDSTA